MRGCAYDARVPSATSLSVVVATHNRAELLPRLVAALEGQRSGGFEAVIVDDASTDDTQTVLAELAAGRPWLRWVRQDVNTGPAGARNRGWRMSSGDLIAFTDDDCVPDAGWVSAMAEALQGADVVQGRTLPDPELADRIGPFGRTISVTSEEGYYQTCNMGYRRSWLERLDGFDERFRRPSGEDTDLAWRAKEAGASSAFAEAALVHHDVRPSSFTMHVKDTWRWGDCVLAVKEHPQLRTLIHRRVFFRSSHPPAILAALGVVAALSAGSAPRRVASLALLVPYADLRLRRWPLRGGPRRRVAAIPAALAADVTEVGVMILASARYRTLVL